MLIWEKGRQLKRVKEGSSYYRYTYNADGIRIKKVANGITYTYFVDDNGSLIGEKREGTGVNLRLTYEYDSTGICAFGYSDTITGQRGKLYYQKNVQGDIIGINWASGITACIYDYDAWGNVVLKSGDSYILGLNRILYRGYYQDIETGWYYLQSRYYDPSVCRFLNADSISYLDIESLTGLNLYSYCANNPVMGVDPTGHFWDYVLDAVFLAWSIADVINDPSDWKNWAALGTDLVFAVVPFVPSGAGQIIKIGDKAGDLARAANKLDNLNDVRKITSVGETMSRVEKMANVYGAKVYGGFKSYKKLEKLGKGGKVIAEIAGKTHNLAWIVHKLRSGYTLLNVGYDALREIRGSSYTMERIIMMLWESRNVWKLYINYYWKEIS